MATPLTFTLVNPNPPEVVEEVLRSILLEMILSDVQGFSHERATL